MKKRNISFGDIPSAVLMLIVIFLYFSLFAGGFLSLYNLNSILVQSIIPCVLVLGVSVVIISGSLDLSVGNVLALSGCVCGILLKNGIPTFLAVPAGILTGTACGFLNGAMISKMKLPPFIATLAMMNIASGLANTISERRPIYWEENGFLNALGEGGILGVSFYVLAGVLVMVLVICIYRFTRLRTNAYVIGGNEEVLHLSGVSVAKWKLIIYSLSGTLAGICGILMNARVTCADPTVGTGLEFSAVVGAVIGGNIQNTGKGSLWGAIVGALTLAVIRNGLSIMKTNTYWQMVLTGLILVVGMLLREVSVRREQRKRNLAGRGSAA